MAGLRQRRGVLAVDHVDRLDEPKEHVHIHRVVRQGALQGTLSFVGMLLPLLAFRALFLPAHYWDVLPMALRCAAGPVGALVWNVGRLENFANGRQRWFNLLAQNSARLGRVDSCVDFSARIYASSLSRLVHVPRYYRARSLKTIRTGIIISFLSYKKIYISCFPQ